MSKTPKDVVQAAYLYLGTALPVDQKISTVRVEELDTFEEAGEKFWNVVLSYDVSGEFSFERTRDFKEFKVKDSDGTVVSMRIKKV